MPMFAVPLRALAAAAMVAASTCGAASQTLFYMFDRPNGGLGPNYATQNGQIVISSGRATVGQFPLTPNLVTVNGGNATAASVDVAAAVQPGGFGYVALAFGYVGSPIVSYFIKVQDNNGDGLFDSYGFYTGNNDSSSSTLFGSLSSPFATGTVQASYSGTIATLSITSAGGVQTYTRDYGGFFPPQSLEVGLGLTGTGIADNLRVGAAVAVPGPIAGAGLLPLVAVGGALVMRRRRQRAA